MSAPHRLTDRQLFAARPWRAADRSQLIVAVVEGDGVPGDGPDAPWYLVIASLQGRVLYANPLIAARTPASFTEEELEALYEASRSTAAT